MISFKIKVDLLSAAFLGEGALVNLLALILVDDGHVRQYQAYVFLGDVAISVEIIASRIKSQQII